MVTAHEVTILRVYDSPEAQPEHGTRVLVDRLWPRGVKKTDLEYDSWPKDITPSTDLRKWYGHEHDRWVRFQERYHDELGEDPAASELEKLRAALEDKPVTLLTAVKDVDHSAAAVIAAFLRELTG